MCHFVTITSFVSILYTHFSLLLLIQFVKIIKILCLKYYTVHWKNVSIQTGVIHKKITVIVTVTFFDCVNHVIYISFNIII